jgi:hypothetical protein
MPSGIAGHHGKIVRENVDNFAFAFIAPLGAYNHCCLAALHWKYTLLTRAVFAD